MAYKFTFVLYGLVLLCATRLLPVLSSPKKPAFKPQNREELQGNLRQCNHGSSLQAVVIGATGATGTSIVKNLLIHRDYKTVHVFARKEATLKDENLHWHVVDFDKLDSWKDQIKGDTLFSAMGTTLATAGSKDAQYKIDYTYQHDVAKAAADNNVSNLVLLSSTGSNSKSPFFYCRIKGQLEDAVRQMNFKSVHIFRPGLLERGEFQRSHENFGIKCMNAINKLGILYSQRPISVNFLARQMIRASYLVGDSKVHTYSAARIWDFHHSINK